MELAVARVATAKASKSFMLSERYFKRYEYYEESRYDEDVNPDVIIFDENAKHKEEIEVEEGLVSVSKSGTRPLLDIEIPVRMSRFEDI